VEQAIQQLDALSETAQHSISSLKSKYQHNAKAAKYLGK